MPTGINYWFLKPVKNPNYKWWKFWESKKIIVWVNWWN
jgi:hypothetical protein